ncbi:MAG: CcoQ/FixQ family Cbb3-type cytochrome c oxidase assembly chaperone [Burkholderiales bacterium]
MDMNIVRSVVTVVSFLAFLAILFWALAPKRKASFDEAARLPFADGDESDVEIKERS